MQYLIKTTSLYAKSVLQTSPCGKVHSIYRRTINLQFGDCLLSLQSNGSPLSPISLITELDQTGMAALMLEVGQPVASTAHCIYTISSKYPCSFSFMEAQIIDLKLRPPVQPLSHSLMAKALSLSPNFGFCSLFSGKKSALSAPKPSSNQELVLSAAHLRIERCTHYFKAGAYELAAQELTLLLGLGIGLTPSGDDFLCGVLAGLTLGGHSRHPFSLALQNILSDHLSDTNDISRAFLICALQSQYSQAVISLPSASSPKDILDSFTSIGHSSGIDTLCGIYYAISIFG